MGPYKVLVDFAHNVAGYEGLAEFVKSLNPKRTIVTLCLPGDRRMEDFDEVSKIVAETYDEAIDTLLWFANDNYTRDEMIWSIKDFEEQMEEGKRELEEELKRELEEELK